MVTEEMEEEEFLNWIKKRIDEYHRKIPGVYIGQGERKYLVTLQTSYHDFSTYIKDAISDYESSLNKSICFFSIQIVRNYKYYWGREDFQRDLMELLSESYWRIVGERTYENKDKLKIKEFTEVILLERWSPLFHMSSPLKLVIHLVNNCLSSLIKIDLLNIDSFLEIFKSKRPEHEVEWRLHYSDDFTVFCQVSLSELNEYGGWELLKKNILNRWMEIEHGK